MSAFVLVLSLHPERGDVALLQQLQREKLVEVRGDERLRAVHSAPLQVANHAANSFAHNNVDMC